MELPNNPIAQHISLLHPVKTIKISTPDVPHSNIMLSIDWDAGVDIRLPELDVPDTSSPDAIIEGRRAISCSGWTRMASTSILIPGIPWDDPMVIQEYVSEIGWRMGAGYMYRYHYAPGMDDAHRWGMIRYICGEDMSHGDTSPDDSRAAHDYGSWSWEINSSYRKKNSQSAAYWPDWYRCDTSLLPDGSRAGEFPGWDGMHPLIRTSTPCTGYESHYFFAPTYRGRGAGKKIYKYNYAVYVAGLRWE